MELEPHILDQFERWEGDEDEDSDDSHDDQAMGEPNDYDEDAQDEQPDEQVYEEESGEEEGEVHHPSQRARSLSIPLPSRRQSPTIGSGLEDHGTPLSHTQPSATRGAPPTPASLSLRNPLETSLLRTAPDVVAQKILFVLPHSYGIDKPTFTIGKPMTAKSMSSLPSHWYIIRLNKAQEPTAVTQIWDAYHRFKSCRWMHIDPKAYKQTPHSEVVTCCFWEWGKDVTFIDEEVYFEAVRKLGRAGASQGLPAPFTDIDFIFSANFSRDGSAFQRTQGNIWDKEHLEEGLLLLMQANIPIWPPYFVDQMYENKLSQHVLVSQAVYNAGGRTDPLVEVSSLERAEQWLRDGGIVKRESSSEEAGVWGLSLNLEEDIEKLRLEWCGDLQWSLDHEEHIFARYFLARKNMLLREYGEIRVYFVGGFLLHAIHTTPSQPGHLSTDVVQTLRPLGDIRFAGKPNPDAVTDEGVQQIWVNPEDILTTAGLRDFQTFAQRVYDQLVTDERKFAPFTGGLPLMCRLDIGIVEREGNHYFTVNEVQNGPQFLFLNRVDTGFQFARAFTKAMERVGMFVDKGEGEHMHDEDDTESYTIELPPELEALMKRGLLWDEDEGDDESDDEEGDEDDTSSGDEDEVWSHNSDLEAAFAALSDMSDTEWDNAMDDAEVSANPLPSPLVPPTSSPLSASSSGPDLASHLRDPFNHFLSPLSNSPPAQHILFVLPQCYAAGNNPKIPKKSSITVKKAQAMPTCWCNIQVDKQQEPEAFKNILRGYDQAECEGWIHIDPVAISNPTAKVVQCWMWEWATPCAPTKPIRFWDHPKLTLSSGKKVTFMRERTYLEALKNLGKQHPNDSNLPKPFDDIQFIFGANFSRNGHAYQVVDNKFLDMDGVEEGINRLFRAKIGVWPPYHIDFVTEQKLSQHIINSQAVYDAGGKTDIAVEVTTLAQAVACLHDGLVIKRESASEGEGVWLSDKRVASLTKQWTDDVSRALATKEQGFIARYYATKYNPLLIEQGEVRVYFVGGAYFQAIHTIPMAGQDAGRLGEDIQIQPVRAIRPLSEVK
ncbi:hypothetical protein CYLTODRAFT_477408 [Cylindrobasidium torrendii FP15055 ss-10]|uniref:Uncharacterized protein n=1 Tax=Cylindrobasidium torrendii FP15055 ss-10 TaxID=1314674 RepID=A0A0D7AUE7_9AGAR|nr:hypothetical protein CYLTODRAFT_477408 [Cylindrobasidium torrendii FP15055 ss-10]